MNRAIYRRLRNSLAGRLLPLALVLVGGRSWAGAQRAGRRLGQIAWKLGRRDRERALTHLRIAFPEVDEETIRAIAYDCFIHLGTSLAEFLHVLGSSAEIAMQQVDIEGLEHLLTARERGRGTLIVSGHLGNWELLGPAFLSRNLPLTAIGRSFEEPWANDLATRFREQWGAQVLRRGERDSARKLLQVFRRRGNLFVLIDHDIDAPSVWVPFFGRLAHTAVGPAQMALRYSLTVIPAFCERLQTGRHRAVFHPPLDLPDDETEATSMMTQVVEEQIRRVPAQWTWMHRRWRRRPAGEEGPEDLGS